MNIQYNSWSYVENELGLMGGDQREETWNVMVERGTELLKIVLALGTAAWSMQARESHWFWLRESPTNMIFFPLYFVKKSNPLNLNQSPCMMIVRDNSIKQSFSRCGWIYIIQLILPAFIEVSKFMHGKKQQSTYFVARRRRRRRRWVQWRTLGGCKSRGSTGTWGSPCRGGRSAGSRTRGRWRGRWRSRRPGTTRRRPSCLGTGCSSPR